MAGSHTVTVKDANGCTSPATFSMVEPAQNNMSVSVTATPINCNGEISTITVTATGGTAPYTGTGTFTGYAGSYTYDVSDAAGHTANSGIIIAQPASITVSLVAGTISRAGLSTTLTASASGGTGTFTYSLNGGAFQPSGTFAAVLAGTHIVTVKDANGCTKAQSITITEPAGTSFRISILSKTNATCKGGNTGAIEVIATGGRAPYSYKLNNGRWSTSTTFRNLTAGVYQTYAKDADGSIVSLVAFVFDGRTRCSNSANNGRVTITSFPNPSSERFSVSIESDSPEDVVVDVMNMFGKRVYEEKGAFNKIYTFGQHFAPGTYFVRVKQAGKVTTQTVVKL